MDMMKIEVGRFGEGPALPAGPLAAYLAQWPNRRVEWDWARQMWQIREANPRTGRDERVALVFWYDTAAGDVEPETADELARMIEARDPRVRKVYRPFDQRYVEGALMTWALFEQLGTRRFVDRIVMHNRRVWERKQRDVADTLASGWGELRNWFPVLAHYHSTGRWEPDRRIPTVPVGISLKGD